MSDERPPPTEAGDGQPPEAARDPGSQETPHSDDGLDLARAAARSLAGGPKRRPRRGGDAGTPEGRRRGGRGVVSGAHPDDRDPQPLDSSVERLVGDRGWELDLRVAGVFARWAELVGPEVGEHSTPESFAEGKLVIRATSTAWATQLKLLAPSVVRRLNEELGHGSVAIVEVLGPHVPSWKKGPRSVRDGRGPRDTYG